MSDPLLWQKVSSLKPALPRHVQIQTREYSGGMWYILHDLQSGRFHRFNNLAYSLLQKMDGRLSMAEIIHAVQNQKNTDPNEIPAEKEDLIELLQYLHVADLLVCDFPPNTQELFQRKSRKKRQSWNQFIANPLIWKIPLYNPNRLLDRFYPLAKLLIRPISATLWLSVVIFAIVNVVSHWTEIKSNQLNEILSPKNLFLIWAIYPFLKIFHELGHALCTKKWGGDITECGVMFVLGTPLPYVDASACTGFTKKSQRILVGAAGMLVELFIAAIALILWTHADEGLGKTILFNIVIIGGVSTLIFNANPLMRFDGYHILCDALNQPNIATRASKQLTYLFKQYACGLKQIMPPTVSTQESWGLSLYGVSAFAYRALILVGIVLIIAGQIPLLGLFFAIWLSLFQFALPLVKGLIKLIRGKEFEGRRQRAGMAVSAAVTILFLFLVFFPIPKHTSAEGILWLPDSAKIVSQSSGKVVEVLVHRGDPVTAGQVLLRLENNELTSALGLKQAQLEESKIRYEHAWNQDRAQIQLFDQELEKINSEILYLKDQIDNLTIRSESAGIFNPFVQHDLHGSYVHQGDQVGFILSESLARVRVVVRQEELAWVQDDTRNIKLIFASQPQSILHADILHTVPNGTKNLPSPALGTAGGGRIVISNEAESYGMAVEKVFLIDLAIKEKLPAYYYGQRARIAFAHSSQTLFKRFFLWLNHHVIALSPT